MHMHARTISHPLPIAHCARLAFAFFLAGLPSASPSPPAPPVSAEAARFLCARAFAGTPPAPADAPPLAPPPLACTGSVNPSAWFNSELESLNESAPGLPKGESAPGL